MASEIDFTSAPVDAVTRHLTQRLDQIRLAQNISQAALAAASGVSRRTLIRMADGQSTSLDSFVRVALALNLGEQLAALLPNPEIRPLEQLESPRPRQRARAPAPSPDTPWTWGDEDET